MEIKTLSQVAIQRVVGASFGNSSLPGACLTGPLFGKLRYGPQVHGPVERGSAPSL
jgi:hypothetical protein